MHCSLVLIISSRPPWFDLPPPPYLQEGELPSEGELPRYEAVTTAAHTSGPPTPRTVASVPHREESQQL